MVSSSTFCFLSLALLLLPACHSSTPPASCIFNSTHCSCRPVETPGTCLRSAGHESCIVDDCRSNGMTCDCEAPFVCQISKCNAWVADATIHHLSSIPRGDSIPCRLSSQQNCVSRIQYLPPVVQQSSATPRPRRYRMVQVGPASASVMFNMSLFTDHNDFIVNKFNMHALWNNRELLRRRFITLRLYRSSAGDAKMICAIFNTYGVKDDQLGNMLVMTNITAASGQLLSWAACDDPQECKPRNPSSVLTARHGLISSLTDGWCVKPLDENGNEINIKFYSVHGMRGLVLQAVDRIGKDRAFLFQDTVRIGMPGTIDRHGLVRGGEFPEIKFNLRGLEVPE